MSKSEKPNVLVVDDNSETCTLLTALLQRDFTVHVANDGLEATERLRTTPFGAVLLDLRMPQHDGFEVLEYLEDHQPEMLKRVIVLTAMLTQREIDRARRYKICDVVPKPFDIDVLLAAVKQCVDPGGPSIGGGIFCSPVILLLADLFGKRLM